MAMQCPQDVFHALVDLGRHVYEWEQLPGRP